MIKSHKLEYFIENQGKIVESRERKETYGEVNTPFSLIESIFKIIPEEDFKNPNFKWLDIGAGSGNFSVVLYFKLLESLKEKISEEEERKDHIIKNMIFMCEIQASNINILRDMFGKHSNIIHSDFLSVSLSSKFTYIIGNPPFNTNGLKKVPTNAIRDKKKDGGTCWPNFIKKAIKELKENGKMCVFIPTIWLKPDKEGIYNLLTEYQIDRLTCLTNTKVNQLFKGNAQTPCCYFLLTKKKTNRIISIYDKSEERYIDFKWRENIPIPVYRQNIMSGFLEFMDKFKQKYGEEIHIDVIKTNMPTRDTILSPDKNNICNFQNISTCRYENRGNKRGKLIINYSNKPQAFFGKPKLVLAHKVDGIPYLDEKGEYGISNRDNYVILPLSNDKHGIDQLEKLGDFLSNEIIIDLFKSTRYRMQYLEKYVFELLPDIRKINDFPDEINSKSINSYFQINKINNI